jgi:hypothetical protein
MITCDGFSQATNSREEESRKRGLGSKRTSSVPGNYFPRFALLCHDLLPVPLFFFSFFFPRCGWALLH